MTASATIAAAPAAASRIPQQTLTRSASTSSLTAKPHLVTAPCTRCGHAEPIKSLLSIVDSSPHYLENHGRAAAAAATGASETLYQSFASLEATLQRHGADLHRLSLLAPPVSREPSIRSVRADDAERPPLGNPLVHDVEDLKQLTAGVTRLLRTLHEKVLRMDRDEKLLRAERDALAAERRALGRERENIDQLRDMLVVGGVGADPAGPPLSPVASRFDADRGKSLDMAPDEFRFKSLPMSRALSFATDDEPVAVWSDEKEALLAQLEERLKKANRNWSDKQEDVLPQVSGADRARGAAQADVRQVERLREERRKAKKHFGRSTIRIDTDPYMSGTESPRRRVASFGLSRKGSASGRSSRRGSDGEEGAREKGGNRLMRFFAKKERDGVTSP